MLAQYIIVDIVIIIIIIISKEAEAGPAAVPQEAEAGPAADSAHNLPYAALRTATVLPTCTSITGSNGQCIVSGDQYLRHGRRRACMRCAVPTAPLNSDAGPLRP